MIITALVLAILGCALILFVGARFLLMPTAATTAFGVAVGNVRALTAIKGVRDLASGIVPLVVLAAAGQHAFGWVILAAAITPIGDAIIVATQGGTMRQALGIHGATAAVLIAAGLVLAVA